MTTFSPIGQVARSNRREVRNPVLGLPDAKQAIDSLTVFERGVVRRILLAIRADAQVRADKCWRTHKAPMALYWKCVAVYTGHIARALAA